MQHATSAKVSLIHQCIVRPTPTMLGVIHLVDEKRHIIFAVDIASFAVLMNGFFDLVLDHGFIGLEMFVAVFVATLDPARHRCLTISLSDSPFGQDIKSVEEMGGKGLSQSDQGDWV